MFLAPSIKLFASEREISKGGTASLGPVNTGDGPKNATL